MKYQRVKISTRIFFYTNQSVKEYAIFRKIGNMRLLLFDELKTTNIQLVRLIIYYYTAGVADSR